MTASRARRRPRIEPAPPFASYFPPAALPPDITFEALVEQTVRGALTALAAVPAGQRPSTVLIAPLALVLTEAPAQTPEPKEDK